MSETIEEDIKRLRMENDIMRGIIAKSSLDCMYCGLPASDMAKCPYGFPGCGRADDLLSDPNIIDGPAPGGEVEQQR